MKLIQTQEYLLLIDEEAEIKEDDYLFDELTSHYAGLHQHSGVEYLNGGIPNIIQCKSGTTSPISVSSKVIAYCPLTKEAKELDLPLLPNPFEEVESIFSKKANIPYFPSDLKETCKYWFIEGYRVAQSKQFSLEDIKKAINFDKYHYEYGNVTVSKNDEEIENFIQSLSTQQTYPKSFIPEYINTNSYGSETNGYDSGNFIPKTTTNSSGKIELVGTWRY